MSTRTPHRFSARLGLITAVTAAACAASVLFLALLTPGHAEPNTPLITPTPVGANELAPRFFRVGSADTRIGVRTLGSASAWASASVHWNGQPLVTTRVADVMYEAVVPSALLSATGTAVVTVTGSGASGWGAVTVFILDAPPAPAPPLAVSISALPGLVSNANLDNDVLMTVTDTTGAPVLNLANTYFSASAGSMALPWSIAPGVYRTVHEYSPGITRIVTPSIAITAHILAPSVYATAVVSFTGTVTRELLYLPRIDLAPAGPPLPSESSIVYSGTVRISALKSVGDLSINEADEYVEITNIGTRAVDVSGWSLTASELVIGFPMARATFNFPSGAVLAPDQFCRIYTNGGGPLDCGFAPGFGWSIGLWPDAGGGLATLRDPAGVRMAEFAYRRFDARPTPTPFPGQPVVVSRIMYQGTEGLQEADEFVEVRNTGTMQIDLSNWSIKAFHGTQQVDSFVFDPGFIIAGGQVCRIYTNLPAGPDSCGIVDGFARDEPLWPNVPNGFYSARLYNAQNVEVSRYTY